MRALNSKDLFLDFSGYDSVNVSLDQLLGLTTFVIPNGTTSAIKISSVSTLAPTAGIGTYPAFVVLQTAAQDITDPQKVSVTITPEPNLFAVSGVALLVISLWPFRTRAKTLLPVLAILAFTAHCKDGQR